MTGPKVRRAMHACRCRLLRVRVCINYVRNKGKLAQQHCNTHTEPGHLVATRGTAGCFSCCSGKQRLGGAPHPPCRGTMHTGVSGHHAYRRVWALSWQHAYRRVWAPRKLHASPPAGPPYYRAWGVQGSGRGMCNPKPGPPACALRPAMLQSPGWCMSPGLCKLTCASVHRAPSSRTGWGSARGSKRRLSRSLCTGRGADAGCLCQMFGSTFQGRPSEVGQPLRGRA